MAYDGKLLARARTRLEQQRSDNQAEQQRRLSQVYLRVPEIQNIDLRMRAGMAELVRLTVSKRPDIAQRLQELRQENLDLQVRRAELLVENGFGLDYLDEIFSCKKCGDTGMYGGAPCQCLERLYNQELTKELGALLRNGNESFESFDLNYYAQGEERERMARNLEILRRYALDFGKQTENLILCGKDCFFFSRFRVFYRILNNVLCLLFSRAELLFSERFSNNKARADTYCKTADKAYN